MYFEFYDKKEFSKIEEFIKANNILYTEEKSRIFFTIDEKKLLKALVKELKANYIKHLSTDDSHKILVNEEMYDYQEAYKDKIAIIYNDRKITLEEYEHYIELTKKARWESFGSGGIYSDIFNYYCRKFGLKMIDEFKQNMDK